MPLDLYPASYDPNNPSTPAGMAPAIKGLTWTVLATPEFSTLNAVESPNALETRLPQTRNHIWHFSLIYDYLYARYRSPQNTYPFAPYSDLDTLMGFYLSHGGEFADFLFDNPKDRTARGVLGGAWQPNHEYALNDVRIDSTGHAELVTVAGTSGANEPNWFGGSTVDGTATWTDQGYFPDGLPDAPAKLQLIDDGFGNYYTPVQRILGGVVYEDVTDLNGPITVWADGVLQPTNNYTILGPGLILNDVLYAGLVLQWAAQPVAPITATFNFYFRMCFEMDTQDFEHFMDELWTIGGSGSKSGSGTVKLISARPVGPRFPAPAPPPLPPPPPIVTSAVLNVVSSYEQHGDVGFQPLAFLSASSPFSFLSFSGLAFWATRTDTAILVAPAPDSVAGYSGVVVTFQLEETLVQPAGLVKWLIDDVNIVLTLADASTQTIRPVSTNFTLGTDGGDVLNASQLTDANAGTGATLESRSGGPLSTNSIFTVTF